MKNMYALFIWIMSIMVQVIVILYDKNLFIMSQENEKGVRDLLHQRWWGKMKRRVEERVVRECSLNVDSTKVHKQRFVSSRPDLKSLCSSQSDLK